MEKSVNVNDLPPGLQKAKFIPSKDGYNENLLLLLQGMGGDSTPFTQLSKTMKIPQCVYLVVEAPLPVFSMEPSFGYCWWKTVDMEGMPRKPSMELYGDELCTVRSVISLLRVLNVTWPLESIFLLGFSQGAILALHAALQATPSSKTIPSSSDVQSAQQDKAQGNLCFAEGDWLSTYGFYQRALEKSNNHALRATVLSNLVATELNMNTLQMALDDAQEALFHLCMDGVIGVQQKHSKIAPKVYLRCAQAHMVLQQWPAAKSMLMEGWVTTHHPRLEEALKEVEEKGTFGSIHLQPHAQRTSGIGGVVCISSSISSSMCAAGILADHDVPLLITHGEQDEKVDIEKAKGNVQWLQSGLSNVKWYTIPGKGHAMPKDALETKWLMQFFAKRMSRRMLSLEKDPDVIDLSTRG